MRHINISLSRDEQGRPNITFIDPVIECVISTMQTAQLLEKKRQLTMEGLPLCGGAYNLSGDDMEVIFQTIEHWEKQTLNLKLKTKDLIVKGLDPEVLDLLTSIATSKKTTVQALANDVLTQSVNLERSIRELEKKQG